MGHKATIGDGEMKKIGFIGCGNMAKAMIGGIVASGLVPPQEVLASARTEATRTAAEKTYGICTTADNREVAQNCEVVVLAVKPQVYPEVIAEIASAVDEHTVLVTIAPGFTLARLEELFGHSVKLVRTMPNTPAMVREGMTAACKNTAVTEQEMESVLAILSSFGKAKLIPEGLMDAVVAVSGSSPAYVYLFIEAMADAAVLQGMPRPMAYEFAAQSVYGAAKMVLETGKHPGELKDMVCSPKGTTIEAVRVLEEKGLRSSVIEAMIACGEKAKKV
ncbi:pyrroline-5-carboxylate reductase [Pygmaiobacter massiliensis]|uniref:pyrroline-5-carboxylate reductase n=1 Tax=Pygmaiobacter massiliensis TaxID=1917873 RepID=UPI002A825A52|nr:pyrroline-5-carboxylate reductase [Pygmaiobacter massiliensis]MDY4784850.1 pyrroline-5-carboxylate reductase [Pygmaiobacter massiliensis]